MSRHAQLDILDRLSQERPEVPDEVVAPSGVLAQRVYAKVTAQSPDVHPRMRLALGIAMAFLLLAGAAVASVVTTAPGQRPSPRLVLAASDMQRIIARTDEATADTGRATITFVLDEGMVSEQTGTSKVTFAGNDLEMVIDFEGRHGRPGFRAVNRSVSGRFYLLDVTPEGAGSGTADAPPEVQRWNLDEAANLGGDPFTVDPRTFVRLLNTGATLEKVGSEQIDGVETEHIRATKVESPEEINLGLGPIQTGKVLTLDVWVDKQDIARQLRLEISWQEEIGDEPLRTKVKHPDGRVTVESIPSDQAGPYATPGTRQHTARYSVRFYDLGAPIEIPPPADAVVIEGKG